MARLGITPYAATVTAALLKKNQSSLWVAIGHTSAWPDEEEPTPPQRTDTDLTEAICFVIPSALSLAKTVTDEAYDLLDPEDRVIVNGVKYGFVTDGNAYTETARYIYIRGLFDPAIHPYGTFRQAAVFSGLVPATGHESDEWLAPSDVQSRGHLEHIDSAVAVVMNPAGPPVYVHAMIECR